MGNCYFRPADEAGGVAGAYSKLLVPYEKACYQDNDLLRMHEMLHKGMGSVLQILISRNALSLDLLRRAVSFLDDCNNQTVAVILDSKENIFNNDIRCLVKDYLELSKKTRSSLFALKEDLINLQEKQAFLLSDVLDGFSPEDTKRKAKAPLKLKKAKVEEMLSKLNSFKSAGCFADGFRQSFPALLEQHKQMVEKMQQQRIRLRKKLTTILWCKKIIFTIFAAVFAASLICSIIAAALHAAPMVISVVTAAISVTSWGPLAKMLDGLWKGDELGHGARLGAMNNLEKRSTAVLHELESIAVLVEGLEQKLGDQVRAVGNTVKIAHDEFLSFKEAIEKNSTEVQVCVKDLIQIVESCMNHLDIRRDEVLSRIMEMRTTEVQKPWLCWWAK